MRVPSMDWLATYMRAGGLIAAGMIIGGALFMSLYHHNFSILYMEKERLKTEVEELKKTLEPLQQNNNRSSIIHQINVHLITPQESDELDEITSLQLKRQLSTDLALFRGKSTDSITDSLLIAKRIIERKIYSLDKAQEFRLLLQVYLIKSGQLSIWAEVRPYIRSD